MRYLLVLPFIVLLITSCSKSDQQKIAGDWGFYQLKRGPESKITFSLDPEKQESIIENEIRIQREMSEGMGTPYDESRARSDAKRQYGNMTKLTFTFTEDGKMKIDTHLPDKSSNQETKYTLDPEKKELVIKSDAREIKYNYEFRDDKMIWKGDQEELTMIRRK